MYLLRFEANQKGFPVSRRDAETVRSMVGLGYTDDVAEVHLAFDVEVLENSIAK